MNGTTQLRGLTPADADALLELSNVCDMAEVGEPSTTAEEIKADFANPVLEHVATEVDGLMTGAAWLEARAGQRRVWAGIRARPGHEAALPELLDWVQRRAAGAGPGRPIWMSTGSSDEVKRGLYEAAGGTVIRRFYRMLIDFTETGPPPRPTLNEPVTIRPMDPTEAGHRTMHRLVDTAFADHFGHEPMRYEDWERSALAECDDPSLYWIAAVDGEPAAGLYACVLPHAGYVDTLGTLREFRGRGLGRALLLTSFQEFARRGVRRVSLAVDATSPTGALGLYESVGMSVASETWRYELPPAQPSGAE